MSPGASELTEPTPSRALLARASQAYSSQSRELVEDRWILDHLPLVRHVVQKVCSTLAHRDDQEDLISAGTLGLVKAARAYDPSRDSEFKTYAYIRIRGAVLDELRGRSFVPSSIHGQLRRVRKAYESLTSETGQPPDEEALAGRLGIAVEQLYRTLEEARKQNFLSIHGLGEDDAPLSSFLPPDDSPSPVAQAERSELLAKLTGAIQALPERDRIVLLLYYERDLTMKEAAQVLGITESRVSQIHATALFKLAMKLKEAP